MTLDRPTLDRFVTWLDTYGQRQGHFSDEQEQRLMDLKEATAALFAPGMNP